MYYSRYGIQKRIAYSRTVYHRMVRTIWLMVFVWGQFEMLICVSLEKIELRPALEGEWGEWPVLSNGTNGNEQRFQRATYHTTIDLMRFGHSLIHWLTILHVDDVFTDHRIGVFTQAPTHPDTCIYSHMLNTCLLHTWIQVHMGTYNKIYITLLYICKELQLQNRIHARLQSTDTYRHSACN